MSNNNLWKAFWFRPDNTEPRLEFEVKAGTFMDRFFTLATSVDRFDSEQEEWLRYGRKFLKEVDDDTDSVDS